MSCDYFLASVSLDVIAPLSSRTGIYIMCRSVYGHTRIAWGMVQRVLHRACEMGFVVTSARRTYEHVLSWGIKVACSSGRCPLGLFSMFKVSILSSHVWEPTIYCSTIIVFQVWSRKPAWLACNWLDASISYELSRGLSSRSTPSAAHIFATEIVFPDDVDSPPSLPTNDGPCLLLARLAKLVPNINSSLYEAWFLRSLNDVVTLSVNSPVVSP